MTPQTMHEDLPNGPVVAALIAGGLGSATLGLMTVLAEASPSINDALNWWSRQGRLRAKHSPG